MKSQAKLIYNEKYNIDAGISAFENLTINKDSDRYEYILPYYNFSTVLDQNYYNGSISLNSSGSNKLNSTNDLKSI